MTSRQKNMTLYWKHFCSLVSQSARQFDYSGQMCHWTCSGLKESVCPIVWLKALQSCVLCMVEGVFSGSKSGHIWLWLAWEESPLILETGSTREAYVMKSPKSFHVYTHRHTEPLIGATLSSGSHLWWSSCIKQSRFATNMTEWWHLPF